MLFKSSDPWPRSHHDLLDHYHAQYDKAIASGEYQPFLYPWGTLGALFVIIYLLIPHQNRPWLEKGRYLAFAWITGFATYSNLYTKARAVAPALGIGLVNAWSIAWVGAIIVCNDAQTDFMRIERTEGVFGSDPHRQKEMTQQDGVSDKDQGVKNQTLKDDLVNSSSGPRDRHGQYAWQPYPLRPFIERLDWVLDIFCNFRGMGWNWRIAALPPPPKPIQTQLDTNSKSTVPKHTYKTHAGQVKQFTERGELLRQNSWRLFKGYLVLDALKTTMMWDPYFWGCMDRAPPSHLPSWLTSSPALTHTYHLVLSMLAVKYALQTVFALGPLFFNGLLSPSLLGARAEPWMYPETWAPYSVVLEKGLAGWWGNWWHQTFRFGFQEPSRKIIEVAGWDKRSVGAKALQLFVAFALSGYVHGSGSYTAIGETRPVRGPMAFFLLQAVGIFVEAALTQAAKSAGLESNLPSWLKRGWTFLYVHVWFYYTAHLLCDDFAQAGVWLFEPIPVSLFRGLGFGPDARDGWWCWSGQLVRWHRGDTWWTTGIAF
ncbi:membrane bound O-acyl transferase family-domain-containing protein [Alternaria rosae]|uniref:membrane bound O-acyl transferase family-domain-containing protein n=1 Tax=Alternaria rosae TaxID=1187941 RepID=UPI001E8E04A0|nr:membrane bound O-acyl transferase family-domain-containing protein [Alternaria rosae]KAH6866548.1 membrane bound O-acyl transferase family-domain-containing protein [Alternaria rosae]